LQVHANAELSNPLPGETFKAIAWKRTQFVNACRRVQNFQALVRLTIETLKRPDEITLGERFSSPVTVTQNHISDLA
jgi:hypothetical protein